MLQHYFKATLRSFWKNKIFVLINIVGLGTALACCIVAFLNWNFNVAFDTNHEKIDEIYRVNFSRLTNGSLRNNGSCPLPLGETIRENISEVNKVARVMPMGGNFKFKNELFATNLSGVDHDFFELFTFDFLHGNGSAIQDKRSIILSQEISEKYFRDVPNPVGETITYIRGDQRIDFRVAGVFQVPPQNSSFHYQEAFFHYENVYDIFGWEATNWALFNSTFVSVSNPAQIASIESQLKAYVEIQNEAKQDYKVHQYYLDPLKGMAVRAESEGLYNHWFNQSLPSAAAIAPGIMALLILLIACFNFTNTSIAISNQRIKEIGIRKVHGALRKQLVFQFLGENLLLCFFALGFALLLASYLVPQYSAMWIFLDIQLNLIKDIQLLFFLIGLLLFTAIIAGSYPAFYISSFQPNTIFRGTVKFSGTNPLTRVLLTLQFTISLIALVCGFVFLQNAEYQAEYDMGFDEETTVYAFVRNESGYQTMRNGLLANTNIQEIGGSRHSLNDSWYTDPVKVGAKEHDVDVLDIGANYLPSISSTMVAGRNFVENSQTDVEKSAIINEEMARIFGWDDPIGQRLLLRDTVELFVVGVVRDILLDGELWQPIRPMLLRHTLPATYRYLTVKTNAANVLEVKNSMDRLWKDVFPDELSTVAYMKDEQADSAEVNYNIRDLFLFLGVIAVLLSAIGQFSLVSLNLKKRQKEIGIRKVLGASSMHITQRIGKEFLIILVITSVLGAVAGAFLSDMLMSSIWAYHVTVQPGVIILSITILVMISVLTVGRKVYMAASKSPAVFIRDE